MQGSQCMWLSFLPYQTKSGNRIYAICPAFARGSAIANFQTKTFLNPPHVYNVEELPKRNIPGDANIFISQHKDPFESCLKLNAGNLKSNCKVEPLQGQSRATNRPTRARIKSRANVANIYDTRQPGAAIVHSRKNAVLNVEDFTC